MKTTRSFKTSSQFICVQYVIFLSWMANADPILIFRVEMMLYFDTISSNFRHVFCNV